MKQYEDDLEIERQQLMTKIQDYVINAYCNTLEKDEVHMLVFDMYNQVGRTAFRLVLDHPNNELLRQSIVDEESRYQSVFCTKENLARLIEGCNLTGAVRSDMFGVLLFACDGVSLFWYPFPTLADGQHRKR